MKTISVVGARPNFVKIAPFIRVVEDHNSGINPGTMVQRNSINHEKITANRELITGNFAVMTMHRPPMWMTRKAGAGSGVVDKIRGDFDREVSTCGKALWIA